MDSTNGHSEKNPKNNEFEKFLKKIKEQGGVFKLSMEDLTTEEKEGVISMMNELGLDEPPEIYCVDFDFNAENLNDVSTEFIVEFLEMAINEEMYEEAEEFFNIIKKRGFDVEISDNSVSLVDKRDEK